MKSRIIKLLVLIFLFVSCNLATNEKFNSEMWKKVDLNSEENSSLRWKMMSDLRKSYQLIGMNKEEIIKLLGKPDDNVNNFFYYYLGYTGMGINTGSLMLTFKHNVVLKIDVYQG